jgi:hypothetical protein
VPFWSDLRLAVRSLIRRPAFAGVVVLTIALGVAANASIFSVVHAVLIEPLPVREPDRLIRPDVRMSGGGGFLISTSIPNFKDWRERNRTLSSIGLNANRSYTLTGGDRPEIVGTRLVLGDFFETLGVPPARGRYITAAESDRGAPAIAVVSDRFVARRLDPSTEPIGQAITPRRRAVHDRRRDAGDVHVPDCCAAYCSRCSRSMRSPSSPPRWDCCWLPWQRPSCQPAAPPARTPRWCCGRSNSYPVNPGGHAASDRVNRERLSAIGSDVSSTM